MTIDQVLEVPELFKEMVGLLEDFKTSQLKKRNNGERIKNLFPHGKGADPCIPETYLPYMKASTFQGAFVKHLRNLRREGGNLEPHHLLAMDELGIQLDPLKKKDDTKWNERVEILKKFQCSNKQQHSFPSQKQDSVTYNWKKTHFSITRSLLRDSNYKRASQYTAARLNDLKDVGIITAREMRKLLPICVAANESLVAAANERRDGSIAEPPPSNKKSNNASRRYVIAFVSCQGLKCSH